MLILTRRIGEQIYIDEGSIRIHLLQERDGCVAIGIEAPKHIDVERKELFFRKRNAKRSLKKTISQGEGMAYE